MPEEENMQRQLPINPRTGLRALGWRKDGRAIWPILGAAEGDGTGEGGGDDGQPSADPSAPAAKPEGTPAQPTVTADDLLKLRDALDKERALRKDAERAAKEGQGYKAKLDEIAEASKSDLEKAVEAARREGETAALSKANDRLRSLEARLMAAQAQFRDPTVAVRLLDLSDVKVTDDGTVDTSAIGKRLDELAKQHPYLLVEKGPALPTPAQAGIGVQGAAKPEVRPGMDRLRHAYSQSSR
jgi:hypothetical protein